MKGVGTAAWVVALVIGSGCAGPGAPDSATAGGGAARLDYGPVVRSVDAHSARFLFHAARGDGRHAPWKAGLVVGPTERLDGDGAIVADEIDVTAATGFVAHLTITGLEAQTRYYYTPVVDGRRVFDPRGAGLPSFVTLPDLGGRNADFTAVFLADQHTPDGSETHPLTAYRAAARARPMFWGQLGDVAYGHITPGGSESEREQALLRDLWRRNFGDPDSPQARFLRSWPLNLATISDHEMQDNFSLNWHRTLESGDPTATLHDRLARYDRSIEVWWNRLGWGAEPGGRLGRAALGDHGQSVMSAGEVDLLADVNGAAVCVSPGLGDELVAGAFVYLADVEGTFHTRVRDVGEPGGCAGGRGLPVSLGQAPERRFGARASLGVGARYARHGHYGSYSPFPYVEFFLLDTTSYRGDPYQERELYARDANRDTDHSRYPWSPDDGRLYIFGDRPHGSNRTTDGVRSWLGPTQRDALLAAVAESSAEVLVVAAGYPLYSAKFEWSKRYWPARECGFDYATEVEQIVDALEATGKLVLWVHGDGHTPMLVQLRDNVYQLQVGPTSMAHTETPGHRSRTLQSGDASMGDSIGGGRMIAGHQPDVEFGDEVEDFFAGRLDQFEGYLRLYFHPGREALRSGERAGLRRGASDRVVELPATGDPARGQAARGVIGKVVRLELDDRHVHSVVRSYEYDPDPGTVVLTLEDPVVTEDPDRLRILLDGNPWVEARWFDVHGREWRDFATVLRRDPRPVANRTDRGPR